MTGHALWFVTTEGPSGPLWIYSVDGMISGTQSDSGPFTSPGGDVRLEYRAADGDRFPTRYLVSDHPLTVVSYPGRPTTRVLRYELAEQSIASDVLPATLTVEAYAAIDRDEDGYSRVAGLYRSITESVPAEPRTLDLTGHRQVPGNGIDGHPDFLWDTGMQGVAFDRQFRHLRPGRLGGVWQHIGRELRKLPHTGAVYDTDNQPALIVNVALELDREVVTWEDAYTPTGRLKKHKERRVRATTTKRLEFLPPRGISAPTKADAIAQLDALVADYVARVEAARVVWCTHCGGNGYTVPTPGTQEGQPRPDAPAEALRARMHDLGKGLDAVRREAERLLPPEIVRQIEAAAVALGDALVDTDEHLEVHPDA